MISRAKQSLDPIAFAPVYQVRVWGGDKLARFPGRSLPEGGPYGESWEVVDRPEVCSRVQDGEFSGMSLRELLREHTAAVMGPGWDPERPFPILVKWLDCAERLSLQVHPPVAVAAELGGEPKTENWYVAQAEPGAALLAGMEAGVTPESFAEALREDRLEALVRRIPSRAGDSLFVPSGRLHAIDAGNLILEVQQNSDTTYRVYDWGRVGLDGNPRTLHLTQSLASIDFTDTEPTLLHTADIPGEVTLVEDAVFRLRRIALPAGGRLSFASGEEPRLLHVVEGAVFWKGTSFPLGSNLLLPYALGGEFHSPEAAMVLVTDRFTVETPSGGSTGNKM